MRGELWLRCKCYDKQVLLSGEYTITIFFKVEFIIHHGVKTEFHCSDKIERGANIEKLNPILCERIT